MTTIELPRTMYPSQDTIPDQKFSRVLQVASSCGSFVMERITGSQYPMGVDTGVPTFENEILTYGEKATWFEDRCADIAFGD